MADTLYGFGLGVASKNSRGEILDVYYPAPLANISGGLASALAGRQWPQQATLPSWPCMPQFLPRRADAAHE